MLRPYRRGGTNKRRDEPMPTQGLMDLSLRGRTALVTGASAGIGAASARCLAELGARVIAVARREEKLKQVIEGLENATYWVLDVNDHKALAERLDAELKSGTIDIVVNNSAGPKGGPILSAQLEEFAAAFQQHLLTNHFIATRVIPKMKEKGFGRIINIISTSVYAPIPNLGVSNTIRAAVASWAKTLSNEVGPYGVTVNSVLPGYTATERLEQLIQATAHRLGKTEEEVVNDWKNAVPARRFAKPEEIASVVGFLASPAASYVNGVAIPVDGGRLPMI